MPRRPASPAGRLLPIMKLTAPKLAFTPLCNTPFVLENTVFSGSVIYAALMPLVLDSPSSASARPADAYTITFPVEAWPDPQNRPRYGHVLIHYITSERYYVQRVDIVAETYTLAVVTQVRVSR